MAKVSEHFPPKISEHFPPFLLVVLKFWYKNKSKREFHEGKVVDRQFMLL